MRECYTELSSIKKNLLFRNAINLSVPFISTRRFSSRIFKHISHDAVIRIVLATYVVRFLLFSFLTHAWSALPVEVLHGVTYSLMWAAASSTASQMALPGTQASCQAIAGAVYWDLGAWTVSCQNCEHNELRQWIVGIAQT